MAKGGYQNRIELQEGTLDMLVLKTLHRLERHGWVAAEWKKSESNRRAKFYRITALGKRQLAADYERWGRMVATIEGIMGANRGEA